MSQPLHRLQQSVRVSYAGDGSEPAPLMPWINAPVRISLGEFVAAVLLERGEVVCFSGKGLLNAAHAFLPVAAKDVACGRTHITFSLADGRVFDWEGREGRDLVGTPVPVPGISNAVRVFAGGGCSFVLCSGGDVYSFGENEFGQLCRGFPSDREPARRAEPLCGVGVREISAGCKHALALLEDGGVLVWGWLRGRHAKGSGWWTRELGSSPVRLSFGGGRLRALSASAGELHCAVATEDGQLWVWGHGDDGRLGLGDDKPVKAPKAVDLPGGEHAARVQCNAMGTLVTASSGRVFECGGYGLHFRGDPVVPDFRSRLHAAAFDRWEDEDAAGREGEHAAEMGQVDCSVWTGSVSRLSVSLRRWRSGDVLRVGTESFAECAFDTLLSDIGVAAESSVHLLRLPRGSADAAMSAAAAGSEGCLQVYVDAAALGAKTLLSLELHPDATVGDVVSQAVDLLRCTTE